MAGNVTFADVFSNSTVKTLLEDDKPFGQGLNIPGIIAVAVFYGLIFVVGLYASWKGKRKSQTQTSEDVMLAGRDIGLVVGFFTMTATWVGGAFINGTAELIYTPGFGLVWTQAPVGYTLSLLVGAILFAKKMREAGYVTMLDPFEQRYGEVMGGLLYIPALLGETFWSAAVLSALGSTLAVILGLDHRTSVIISAGIAVFYTVVGGLYSVAYTDVIQLLCIFVGLWLGVGFSLFHPAVSFLGDTVLDTNDSWLGEMPKDHTLGVYIDSMCLLIFGGIPWQAYFQRVLSSSSAKRAQVTSIFAALGCFCMAIPPALIGLIARATYWNETEYINHGPLPVPAEDYKLILPMVLRYLTPLPVSLIGLGAVSAAVMSSADSSILSASSMFAKNIYKPIRDACSCGSEASDGEVLWVMRIAIVLVGVGATGIAITVDSIYGLWYLCGDLCYVILFPQLLLVIYFKHANVWGSLAGFLVGFILRLCAGEPLLGLPPAILYPWYDQEMGQLFPHKTFAMLLSMVTIIFVSFTVRFIYSFFVPPEELDYILMRKTPEHDYGIEDDKPDGFIMASYKSRNIESHIT